MADFDSDMEAKMRLSMASTLEVFEPIFEATKGVKTRMIEQEDWSVESAEVLALGYFQFVTANLVQSATKQ